MKTRKSHARMCSETPPDRGESCGGVEARRGRRTFSGNRALRVTVYENVCAQVNILTSLVVSTHSQMFQNDAVRVAAESAGEFTVKWKLR